MSEAEMILLAQRAMKKLCSAYTESIYRFSKNYVETEQIIQIYLIVMIYSKNVF